MDGRSHIFIENAYMEISPLIGRYILDVPSVNEDRATYSAKYDAGKALLFSLGYGITSYTETCR